MRNVYVAKGPMHTDVPFSAIDTTIFSAIYLLHFPYLRDWRYLLNNHDFCLILG
jgi:hypothetical protein